MSEEGDAVRVMIWVARATVNDTDIAPEENLEVALDVAVTSQFPKSVNVITPVEGSTTQLVVPALVTEYVMIPDPVVVARLDGDAGESMMGMFLLGDQASVGVASVTVKVEVSVAAANRIVSPAVAVTLQTPVEVNDNDGEDGEAIVHPAPESLVTE